MEKNFIFENLYTFICGARVVLYVLCAWYTHMEMRC